VSASSFVVLNNGVVLPIAAVRLALDLESRGCSLELDGDGFTVGPSNLITDADRREIRRWREPLIAILQNAEHEAAHPQ
jgi:hypothetical protein